MAEHTDLHHLPSVMVDLHHPKGLIDSLHLEDTGSGTIRISGWSQGQMLTHPLEVTENELIRLIQKAIRAKVLSDEFLSDLRSDFEI